MFDESALKEFLKDPEVRNLLTSNPMKKIINFVEDEAKKSLLNQTRGLAQYNAPICDLRTAALFHGLTDLYEASTREATTNE